MFPYQQAVGHPIITPTGITVLLKSFASDSVIVQREVEAFSFQSLVADCGGVLGLFIRLQLSDGLGLDRFSFELYFTAIYI